MLKKNKNKKQLNGTGHHYLFGREKSRKSPPPTCVFFKYVLKTGAGMRYTWLTDYELIRPCCGLDYNPPPVKKIAV